MILYPDQRVRDQQPDNETVCFAAPIDSCDWNWLHAQARCHELPHTGMRYTIIENESGIAMGDAKTSVYFMRNQSEINDQVCILLRENQDADLCLESAAWIRIQENFPGMIYICRGSTSADQWQTHNASLGAPQEYVCMVDIDIPSST